MSKYKTGLMMDTEMTEEQLVVWRQLEKEASDKVPRSGCSLTRKTYSALERWDYLVKQAIYKYGLISIDGNPVHGKRKRRTRRMRIAPKYRNKKEERMIWPAKR